jgi:Carboxypeptidase regulatory-like domain
VAPGRGSASGPPVTLAERAPSPTSGAVTGDTHAGGATVSWFGPESGSTLSELSGVYVVAGLTPGTYNLVATFPGCDPATATVTVSAGVTLTQNLPVAC